MYAISTNKSEKYIIKRIRCILNVQQYFKTETETETDT